MIQVLLIAIVLFIIIEIQDYFTKED